MFALTEAWKSKGETMTTKELQLRSEREEEKRRQWETKNQRMLKAIFDIAVSNNMSLRELDDSLASAQREVKRQMENTLTSPYQNGG